MVEEKPFRVLLDLSELNLSVSKYVWMNVSPRELNNIADFKYAVLKKLNFDRREIKLFVHDGLLPEDEKIIILRENDTVKVQYGDPSNEVFCNSSLGELNASKFPCSGRNSGELSGGIEKEVSRKRKRKSDTNDVAEVNNEPSHKAHKKKRKHKVSHSFSTPEENECASNSNEKITPNVTINKSEIDDVPVVSIDVHGDESENTYNVSTSEGESGPLKTTEDVAVVSGSNCKKRKRKRHKKRKNVPGVAESLIPCNAASPAMQVKSTESTFSDKFSCVRKHIRFTSPTPSFDTTNGENVGGDFSSHVTKFKSQNSSDLSPNAYKTPNSPVNKTVLNRKNSTPTSQTYLKQNSWNVSPLENESFIETEQPSIQENLEPKAVKKEVKLLYTDYPELNCLPSVGTHVAFKTLELDENYSPSVTSYKEGIIRNIDQSSEALEIELVEEEIKPGRSGKFENLARDEVPSDQIIRTVTLNWSSLIEPRWIIDD